MIDAALRRGLVALTVLACAGMAAAQTPAKMTPPPRTIADITALRTVDFMRVIKLSVTPEMKNLARWHASVSARPSAKA